MSQFQIKPFIRANLTQPDTVTQSISAPPVAEAPRVPEPTPKARKPYAPTRNSRRPTITQQASIPRLESPSPDARKPKQKRAFVLPDLRDHAQSATLYSLRERVGIGGMDVCSEYPNNTLRQAKAVEWLQGRAAHWLEAGYVVTWHAAQTWFDATREAMPTVYAVVWEVADA